MNNEKYIKAFKKAVENSEELYVSPNQKSFEMSPIFLSVEGAVMVKVKLVITNQKSASASNFTPALSSFAPQKSELIFTIIEPAKLLGNLSAEKRVLLTPEESQDVFAFYKEKFDTLEERKSEKMKTLKDKFDDLIDNYLSE